MSNFTLSRDNPHLRLKDDSHSGKRAAALLRRVASDIEGAPALWRDRVMTAVCYLLDGPEADLTPDELRYLRDVIRVDASAGGSDV
jgi:hypothetical protein